MTDLRTLIDLVEQAQAGSNPDDAVLYHGTSLKRFQAILKHGFTPRGGRTKTFGKATYFGDCPEMTRLYADGIVLVCRIKEGARMLSLEQYQSDPRARRTADGVFGGKSFDGQEIAMFNPAMVEVVGYYELHKPASYDNMLRLTTDPSVATYHPVTP